jgi:hypothetical protein
MIIYRAQSWAVSVKFKLRINELFTRYRPQRPALSGCPDSFGIGRIPANRGWRAVAIQYLLSHR